MNGRRVRPQGPPGEAASDALPDDATSSCPGKFMGPWGATLNDILLKDVEMLQNLDIGPSLVRDRREGSPIAALVAEIESSQEIKLVGKQVQGPSASKPGTKRWNELLFAGILIAAVGSETDPPGHSISVCSPSVHLLPLD